MADKIALAAGALGLANTAYDTVSSMHQKLRVWQTIFFQIRERNLQCTISKT